MPLTSEISQEPTRVNTPHYYRVFDVNIHHVKHEDLFKLSEASMFKAAMFSDSAIIELPSTLTREETYTGYLASIADADFSDGVVSIVDNAIRLGTLFIRLSPTSPVYPEKDFTERVNMGKDTDGLLHWYATLCNYLRDANLPTPQPPKSPFKKAVSYLKSFSMGDWIVEVEGLRIYRYRTLKGLPYYEW